MCARARVIRRGGARGGACARVRLERASTDASPRQRRRGTEGRGKGEEVLLCVECYGTHCVPKRTAVGVIEPHGVRALMRAPVRADETKEINGGTRPAGGEFGLGQNDPEPSESYLA